MQDAGARWHEVAPPDSLPPPPLPQGTFCPAHLAGVHRAAGGMSGPLGCWTLPGGTVSGRFLTGHAGRTVAQPDIQPAYVRTMLGNGELPDAPHRAQPRTRRIPGRLACIGSLGYETYGHWLLDILPRLWVLRAALGAEAGTLAFAVPNDLPGFGRDMLAILGIGPDRLVPYARDSEALEPDELVVPTLMHRDYHFHPLANRFFDELTQRFAPPSPAQPRRILLSRQEWRGPTMRRLANFPEIAATLAPRGIQPVSPETLPWPEQIALFAGASLVVGEHGSAMKNLVFAPPGTTVVNLHLLNDTQSQIAALRGHHLAYLEAEVTETAANGAYTYRIDPHRLLACLDAMEAAA